MPRRSAPPGRADETGGANPITVAVAQAQGDELWDGYLAKPNPTRIGICTSGGGIRSAAFALGALQVLREGRVLERAEHLACVSGGGYVTIAHTLLVSETLEQARIGRGSDDPVVEGDASLEEEYFGRQAPWAPGSPEEQHLRDRLKYLAPGLRGWTWFILNLLYGIVRHLLPFIASIYVAAFITGIGMSLWLQDSLSTLPGQSCRGERCLDASELRLVALVGAALLFISGLLLAWRTWRQKRPRKSLDDAGMRRLQNWALGAAGLGIAVLFLGVAVPRVLVWLHSGWLTSIDLPDATGVVALATAASSAAAWVAKNRRTKWFQVLVAVLVWLSAPILVLVPYLGVTYWNAQAGTDWGMDPQRWILAAISILILSALLFLDEITSTAHLFYRERLATAFVGYRRKEKDAHGQPVLRHEQPPWSESIVFTDLKDGQGPARLPNLIVCAAANLSGDLPAGRLGASMTFEKEWAGGPTTGYVRTRWVQEAAGDGVVTLPALIAISGAAVAPSMGKMTIPALRFVMAMFNLRLGVWIPNPLKASENLLPWQLRAIYGRRTEPDRATNGTPGHADEPSLTEAVSRRFRRPGGIYVFREAIGANTLERSYVYVTDGGHWDNLGLVELLRRGCGKVIVIDGSGGDAKSFGTLSEAIALARADLGVEITINLKDVKADEHGNSKAGFAKGRILYPDESQGVLLYVRAVRTPNAPQDVVGYAAKDAKFPNHPTSDQFFNEARFEAYRALGRHLMMEGLHGRDAGPFESPAEEEDESASRTEWIRSAMKRKSRRSRKRRRDRDETS